MSTLRALRTSSSLGGVSPTRPAGRRPPVRPPRLPRVSAKSVALIPRCVECEAAWLPADEERWQAHRGGDDLDVPAEVFFYCPRWAEREFGDS
jgi:hypothetical protein